MALERAPETNPFGSALPFDPRSPEAQTVLHQLKRKRKSKNYYSHPRPRIPDTNRYGLVIPPERIELEGRGLTAWERGRLGLSDHHLYYPRKVFKAAGDLAYDFRNDPFNQIALPQFQHDRLHRRYDPFIESYPTYLIPKDEEVMATFIDEAKLLRSLSVCVRNVTMIDEGIYEDIEEPSLQQQEERARKFEELERTYARAQKIEIVWPSVAQRAMSGATQLLQPRPEPIAEAA